MRQQRTATCRLEEGRARHDAHEYHFDVIAHEYEEQIPRHIRERLLAKKIALMRASVAAAGIGGGAAGLDLGCGQGWYLGALSGLGFRMHGIDYSAGHRKLRERRPGNADGRSRLRLRLSRQADAQALPFPDGSFDFAYSINAFHHLPSRAAQERAVREIVRVLRPGGVFILHEINTQNPVFRLYVGYLFPLIKQIDEGTERWILPSELPPAPGATWTPELQYFTFTPDFVPIALQPCWAGSSAPGTFVAAPLQRPLPGVPGEEWDARRDNEFVAMAASETPAHAAVDDPVDASASPGRRRISPQPVAAHPPSPSRAGCACRDTSRSDRGRGRHLAAQRAADAEPLVGDAHDVQLQPGLHSPRAVREVLV